VGPRVSLHGDEQQVAASAGASPGTSRARSEGAGKTCSGGRSRRRTDANGCNGCCAQAGTGAGVRLEGVLIARVPRGKPGANFTA
jgi:hypothetical protein